MRPTVWRSAMACSAVRQLLEGELASRPPGRAGREDALEDLGMRPFAGSVRGEVVAGRRFEGGRVVDVGMADAEEREVPEEDGARHDPLVLGLNARGEPDQEMAPVEGHAAEGVGRDSAPDRIERHVDATALGGVEDGGDEVLLVVVDGDSARRGTGTEPTSPRTPPWR